MNMVPLHRESQRSNAVGDPCESCPRGRCSVVLGLNLGCEHLKLKIHFCIRCGHCPVMRTGAVWSDSQGSTESARTELSADQPGRTTAQVQTAMEKASNGAAKARNLVLWRSSKCPRQASGAGIGTSRAREGSCSFPTCQLRDTEGRDASTLIGCCL